MKKVAAYTYPLPLEEITLPFRDAYNKSSFSTYAEFAAATGIPEHTVSRILGMTSKEPSFYNLTQMARVLNEDLGYAALSLDAILGVADFAPGRCPEHAALEAHVAELESQVESLRNENAYIAGKQSRSNLNRMVHGLITAVVLLCALVAYLVLDAIHPEWGVFRML